MQITLNGSARQCGPATTITQLLADAGYADRRVAVEVNREIVPRSRQAECVLNEGDHVEIAHAMKLAIQAGRAAFRAGRIPRKRYASASSPIDGTIG